jgi:hypothetical protein
MVSLLAKLQDQISLQAKSIELLIEISIGQEPKIK